MGCIDYLNLHKDQMEGILQIMYVRRKLQNLFIMDDTRIKWRASFKSKETAAFVHHHEMDESITQG